MIKQLITNKDFKEINKKFNLLGKLTPDEVTLLRESVLSESQIQIGCHNIIKAKYGYLNNALVNFIQVDNGGAMGVIQKKKKKAEGTQKGFFDVVISLKREMSQGEYLADFNKVLPIVTKDIFVEFKKIGSYKITTEQQFWPVPLLHYDRCRWQFRIYRCH